MDAKGHQNTEPGRQNALGKNHTVDNTYEFRVGRQGLEYLEVERVVSVVSISRTLTKREEPHD